MLNNEIEHEITRLQGQIENFVDEREKAEKNMYELGEIIGKIKAKTKEIEDGLQETARNIEKKIECINGKSLFKARYFENAKKTFLNSYSSAAIQEMTEMERKATQEYYDLEDKISGYQNNINRLESELNALKQQLM